ncbi:MAG TPA: acylphosphatase [Thermodesulfovibrionales bacterium]|nr:acylphosphatase [Thermodesulfovibrionales bacterium]
MQARAHLLISGRVQGVYYRGFARDIASRFGLAGWVRNLNDGRVEALFEGPRDDIEKAIAHCRSGPPGARVDDIEVEWHEHLGDLHGFEVRYG